MDDFYLIENIIVCFLSSTTRFQLRSRGIAWTIKANCIILTQYELTVQQETTRQKAILNIST